MKTLRLRFIFFTPFFLLISIGCESGRGNVLPFIEKVTNTSFPAHLKILSEFDNGEFEAMGKYLLPSQDIPAFVASHPFVPVPTQHPRPPLCDFNYFCRSNLIPLSDSIPSTDTHPLYYFTGCKPGNAWTFILDEKTGELWINIQYPDPGGLSPGCSL